MNPANFIYNLPADISTDDTENRLLCRMLIAEHCLYSNICDDATACTVFNITLQHLKNYFPAYMAITTDFIKRRELDLLPHTFDKPGRIRAAQKSIRYNILTMQQALFAYSITEYDLQTEVAEPAPYIPGEIELRLRVMWALIDIEKGRDSGQALATYHITAAQLQAYQQLWQGLTEDQKHLIARCAVGYSETNLRTIQNAAKRAVSNLGYSIEEAAAMYNLDNIFR